jgi:beta-mannosidase
MKRYKTTLLILLSVFSCFANAQNTASVSLNGKWQLHYGLFDENSPKSPEQLFSSGLPTVTATVPGNVELDLLAAGLIKNPETGNNVYDLRKYEAYQWWYSRNFKTPKKATGERIELVLEGLDCFSAIWVNNQLVGKTENMFVEHRFDLSSYLKKNEGDENQIVICINPAVAEAQKYIYGTIGTRVNFSAEQVNVRKAPHMYGWDIMPRLISAGLWREVKLEIIKPTHFASAYWMTNTVDLKSKKAEIIFDWQTGTHKPTDDGLKLELSLHDGTKEVFRQSYPMISFIGREKISLDNAAFWWPRGYGQANLYKASARILDAKGEVLDEKINNLGIRTAELIHTEITTPENPGQFVFRINGEDIFVRGTNWVPLDALHSRDKMHLDEVFKMVVDLNCNMLRCWGGNVYEDNDFFDLCDKNGIMVWQDFAMACTVYPQSDDFAEKLRSEAIQVVLKLRQHPSLVLWSGDNENDESITWIFAKKIDPNRNRVTREVLPQVIWEYDPLRDFLPSSPYHSRGYFENGSNGDLRPEVHLWGPRGYYKAPFYTQTNAHFVSEIGYHGCPNRESLEKMFDPEFVYPWTNTGAWNDQWQTKAVRPLPEYTRLNERNNLMRNQVIALFGECPKDLDDFIFASQTVQAEAMKFFVEMWRMDKFNKTGIIWWNLRDGWPILSDAVVDYYNSKKLAYYYIKQVQHNACVMIGDPKNGKHPVIAVNDTREKKSGKVSVKDAGSGKVLFSGQFDIEPNGKTAIWAMDELTDSQGMWLIEYTVGDKKYTNHYLYGKAPFKLEEYKAWFSKLELEKD